MEKIIEPQISFRCGCPDGFVLHNIYQECVDANECLGESQNDHNACGSAKCQNSFGSFTCLCPNGYSFNGNLAVCVQSSSGCGGAGCAFGCNSRGPSAGFDCQCPKGHQVLYSPIFSFNYLWGFSFGRFDYNGA